MSAYPNLLSFLTSKYDAPAENIATEAFCFILNSSSVANKALLDYVGQFVEGLPANLSFQTQDGTDDGGVLDLVGYDAERKPRLIVESKFWAGLTERQPVAYFQGLSSSNPSILLFLAPSRRLPTLWPELIRRMEAAGIYLQLTGTTSEVHRIAMYTDYRYLVATSWDSLLRYLHDALATQGETRTAWDIAQLQGMTEQQDTHAFVPLNSVELAPGVGRRILDFCSLIEACYEHLKTKPWVDTKRLKIAWGQGLYGRYLNIHEYGARLWFTANYWTRLAETPLYLDLGRKGFSGGAADLELRLAPLTQHQPPNAFSLGNGFFTVPLHPLVGQEFEQVVADLLNQINTVADMLRP